MNIIGAIGRGIRGIIRKLGIICSTTVRNALATTADWDLASGYSRHMAVSENVYCIDSKDRKEMTHKSN